MTCGPGTSSCRSTPRSPPAGTRRSPRSNAASRSRSPRRTGRDLESDLYPTLVVTAASGALKAAVSVWQERGRRDPLAELIDEAFRTIASGFALPVAVTAG